MAIPNKQIGWSNESNLLWQISSQMEKLTGVAYAAGSSIPGIDSVLLQAQPLTGSRGIEFNGNNLIFTSFGNQIAQFFYDGNAVFGDIDNQNTSTKLFVEASNERIRTEHGGNDKGMYLDFLNNLYSFGDVGNVTSSAVLKINSAGGSGSGIQTFNGNNTIGLNIDFSISEYDLGDFAGYNNNTFIKVDDSARTTTISGDSINLSDNGNGTLTSNSAGSDSGNFLVITINGSQYKINLLNP